MTVKDLIQYDEYDITTHNESKGCSKKKPSSILPCISLLFVLGSFVSWKRAPYNEPQANYYPQHTIRATTAVTKAPQFTSTIEGNFDASTLIKKFNASDIDWSDSIFQHFESDNDPIVIESHKLLFFSIPKNGCTEWKQLFRRIMGYDNWNKEPFLHPHNPNTNGLFYLGTYPREKQEEFMTSPEWTRAMIIRDPLERTLSAYLNKGLSPERYIKKVCCHISPQDTDQERQEELQILQEHNKSCVPLAPWETQPTAETFTFETFVNDFMYQCNDKHWKPQSQRMHPDNWKFLNFIGRFDNLQDDARRLLEKIGAYEEYGSNGWGKEGTLGMFERERSDVSNTHSRDRISKFYTPELMTKVLQYLKGDYENPWLNFTLQDSEYLFS